MTKDQRIAIVGMGCVFPGGQGPEGFWDLVVRGGDASQDIPEGRWPVDAREYYEASLGKIDRVGSRRGCFVPKAQYDTSDLPLEQKLVEGLDPLFHLTLRAGFDAWKDCPSAAKHKQRGGVILGNIVLPTQSSAKLAESYLGQTFTENLMANSPLASNGKLGKFAPRSNVDPRNAFPAALPAAILAKMLGLGQGSYTLDAACASSLYALKLARDELLSGRLDVVISGGVSRPDPLYTQMGFSQLRAISLNGRSAPFDSTADGLVVGEGAGLFVLKRLDDAVKDGDHIYGLLSAVGLANDIGGGLMAPNSEGQVRAMKQAYKQAGWQPSDVDYVECHATGTPLGDGVEVTSLKTLWNGSPEDASCVISSVKSNIGHLLTAAGASGLARVLLALKHKTLPPTANYVSSLPKLGLAESPFRILQAPQPWSKTSGTPRRAAISGFGFGGINAHALIEEYIPASNVSQRSTTVSQNLVHPRSSAATSTPKKPVRRVAIVSISAQVGDQKNEALESHLFSSVPPSEASKIGSTPASWQQSTESQWWKDLWTIGVAPRTMAEEFVSVPLTAFRIPPTELQEMLPQQVLMLKVAADALKEAGYDRSDKLLAGVFIGIGLDAGASRFQGRWQWNARWQAWAKDLGRELSEADGQVWLDELRNAYHAPLTANRTMGALGGIVASRVAREFHFGGPSFTISADELSGIRALDAAGHAVASGELDMALVGAVDFASQLEVAVARQCWALSEAKETWPVYNHGSVALVLRPLEDAERDGQKVLAIWNGSDYSSSQFAASLETTVTAEWLAPKFGYTGACSGLLGVWAGVKMLDRRVTPQMNYWLHNRGEGARRQRVEATSLSGESACVRLEAPPNASARCGLGIGHEPYGVVMARGSAVSEIIDVIRRWQEVDSSLFSSQLDFASELWRAAPSAATGEYSLALVLTDRQKFSSQCDEALSLLNRATHNADAWRAAERLNIFWGRGAAKGELALLFPGSGQSYRGMGQQLAAAFPQVLEQQHHDFLNLRDQFHSSQFWNVADQLPMTSDLGPSFAAQSCVGSLVADTLASVGVRPTAAIGYSLGESAALLSMHACQDRDTIFSRLGTHSLFTEWVGGTLRAVQRAWGLGDDAKIDWATCLVLLTPEIIRKAIKNEPRVYLQNINHETECVVGGDRSALQRVVKGLKQTWIEVPGIAAVHCEVVEHAREVFEDFHTFTIVPPKDLRFYSGASGKSYIVTTEAARDALTAHSIEGIDFPRMIRQAYDDGVRTFLEVGPGASLTRLIPKILGEKPYDAFAICTRSEPEVLSFYVALAKIFAGGHTVDLRSLYQDQTSAKENSKNLGMPSCVVTSSVPLFQSPMPPVSSKASMPERVVMNQPNPQSAPVFSPAPKAPIALAESRSYPFTLTLPSEAPAPMYAPSSSLPIEAQTSRPAYAPTLYPSKLPTSFALALTQQIVATELATLEAHRAHLALSASNLQASGEMLSRQIQMTGGTIISAASPPGTHFVDSAVVPVALTLTAPVAVTVAAQVASATGEPPLFDFAACQEFARGSIAKVLGPQFAIIDTYPTRVRLPDGPLLLCHRIMSMEAEIGSMGSGRLITEHDVVEGAWYLDQNKIPTAIAVESGQADLFLSAVLGIDFKSKGLACYRLLDAVVTFYRELPVVGDTIRYDIRIHHFFNQGETTLFRFSFEATVNGQPLMTMNQGCAGFFTQQELALGKGVVKTALDLRPMAGLVTGDFVRPIVNMPESLSDAQVDALRVGDFVTAFGPQFNGLELENPVHLPGGMMRLVHRIIGMNASGGRFGLGQIRGEADIHPDDWFLTCHFVDDKVMPGTLMYECCMHTLRVYLLAMGWVGEAGDMIAEPIPGMASQLKCRGQVLTSTQKVTYEITPKEIGYRPEAYVIVDALMFADGKPIVEINNMTLHFAGYTKEKCDAVWANAKPLSAPENSAHPVARAAVAPAFGPKQIIAYAEGKPSEAFGDPYKIFDGEGRKLARLPRDPYMFLDRVEWVNAKPWEMVAGGELLGAYDVPKEAWYFAAENTGTMPFAILLEIALQPCGFFAAYLGSALTSETDISFRNLGGKAIQHQTITPDCGTLLTHITITKVSKSGGMIIQDYTFCVRDHRGRLVYEGTTVFGFFSKEALAQQVGVRGAKLPTGRSLAANLSYPDGPSFPVAPILMVDTVEAFDPEGGATGQGYLRGTKLVDPKEWFFQAHFYQDPVMPGSLGLEAFLQVLKVAGTERWGATVCQKVASVALTTEHEWIYRGQVIPENKKMTVDVSVTSYNDQTHVILADGFLSVDGKCIYQMKGFALQFGSVE